MSGPGRRFEPSELRASGQPDDDEPSDAELAEALAMARELEALSTDGIRPTDGFEDRVMAAIATEPAPRLVIPHSTAVRGGRAGAFLVALRDAWRVGTSGGRPIAIRAQALAFVLVVVLAAGALTTATAITVGSFLLGSETAQPSPSIAPTPSAPPTPSTAPTPSQTPEPSETPEATQTLEPGETPEANETPKPGETPRPTRTPRPTDTPKPEDTPDPDDTPEPTGSDDHGGGGGSGDDGGGGSGPG